MTILKTAQNVALTLATTEQAEHLTVMLSNEEQILNWNSIQLYITFHDLSLFLSYHSVYAVNIVSKILYKLTWYV